MKKLWCGLVAVAAVYNGIRDSIHWYNGEPATSWIWLAAILFSVGLFLSSIRDLVED